MEHGRSQRGRRGHHNSALWRLVAAATASVASLTALALAADCGPLLLTAQAVAASACLGCTALLCRSLFFKGGLAAHSAFAQGNQDGPCPAEAPEDRHWLSLVEGMVLLLDELESHRPDLPPDARELVDHVDLRVQEVLERSGVVVIAGDTAFDRCRHQPQPGAAQARPGTPVLETLRPGLVVGRRVFRRARVRLAAEGLADSERAPGRPEQAP